MATTSLSGLSTGIDTSALIQQLMAVERRSLNIYLQRKTAAEEKKDALISIETKLSTFRTTARAMADASTLRAFSTASSDSDVLTAETTSSAYEGSHTVIVNRLANAERWVHTSGLEYAEDYVGEGTFIYSYNHEETSMTTTATTTLEELVGMINNDADNPGVTASLLNYNGAYHLVLNGNKAGSDYEISINASSTETWQADSAFTVSTDNATLSTKITALDQFGDNPLEGTETITISGTDHAGAAITPVNISVTANTKISHIIDEINDAFDGVAKARLENGKIVLVDDTAGTSSLSISLAYNANGSAATLTMPTMAVLTEGGATTADLTAFAASTFTETQSAQDSQIRVDGFPTPQAGTAEVQTLTPTVLPTSGTFTLTYDGQTTDPIAYSADAATIQTALEALSNVNAGDITVGGTRLNQADATTFTFQDTAGDVSMISINPGNLSTTDPSNYVIAEQTKGNNYGWIERSSNTIDDVISGLTLHLHDTGTIDVTLTRDIESVKDKLSTFVDSYNAVVTYIKEKTGYNQITRTSGILMGDYVVSTIASQLRNPLFTQTDGFIEDVDSFVNPVNIGFELDSEGILNFDTNAFDEAIADDYMGVLALIGAAKTGSSDSNTIRFYGASSKYTTAGEYDVSVNSSGGTITSAQIKLASESTWRDATISGNIITGNSTFNNNGDPNYAENGLQFSIDTSADGAFTATVNVKQGFAGKLEDALDRMLQATNGTIVIDKDYVDNIIEQIDDKIESEEDRLDAKETRLVARFARLEKTLTLLQMQMQSLGFA